MPKLNEGDQIVLINGRDISEHTHDQVVMFIKASRESHSRELALVIRRKGNRLPGAGPQGYHLSSSSGLSTQLLWGFFFLFFFVFLVFWDSSLPYCSPGCTFSCSNSSASASWMLQLKA
jgi:hypothetical protein